MAGDKKGRKVGNHKKHAEQYRAANKQDKGKASRLYKHLMKCQTGERIKSANNEDGERYTVLCAPDHDTSAIAALKKVMGYLTPYRRAKLKEINVLQ